MSADAEAVARRLIEAFDAIDFDGMRSQLADDLRAYVTNAEGGVDEYLRRLAAMDLPTASFSGGLTQSVSIRRSS